MATFAEHHPLHEELDVEDGRIARWRHDQFALMGFGEEEAWLLAASDVDLHEARSLVASGCPLHLALRILV